MNILWLFRPHWRRPQETEISPIYHVVEFNFETLTHTHTHARTHARTHIRLCKLWQNDHTKPENGSLCTFAFYRTSSLAVSFKSPLCFALNVVSRAWIHRTQCTTRLGQLTHHTSNRQTTNLLGNTSKRVCNLPSKRYRSPFSKAGHLTPSSSPLLAA